MKYKEAYLRPRGAAAERGPETVLPGPRSLSALAKVRENVVRMHMQALLDSYAAEDEGRLFEQVHKEQVGAVLIKVLKEIDEAISEESKANAEVCQP